MIYSNLTKFQMWLDFIKLGGGGVRKSEDLKFHLF